MSEVSLQNKENAMEQRRILMTTAPIPGLIVKLAIPSIISMMITMLYNLADTYFVGQISTEATAAVGVVLPVMMIMQAFGFFCGHGSGNYISMKLGSGDVDEAKRMAAFGFFLAFALGICILMFGQIFANQLAALLGATPAIRTMTVSYLRILLVGAPFIMSQFVVNNQLRFAGSATYGMVGLVIGSVVNVILDPILMFVVGLGVQGAAIATVFSQFLSFVILLVGSSMGPNVRISIRNLKLEPLYMQMVFKGGFPSLVRQGLNSVMMMTMNHVAASVAGEPGIAAMSIVGRVMMISVSIIIGFGHGLQPVCTFNYGAGKINRLKEARIFCIKYGTIFMTVMGILTFVFAPVIVAFFRDDPKVVEIGSTALRFLALSFPFEAYVMMNSMTMQSINMVGRATFLAIARAGLFYIPLVLILSHFFGLLGLEMTQLWANIGVLLVNIPLARGMLRDLEAYEREQKK